MPITFKAFDPETCEAIREGRPDANGQPAERGVSDGGGVPCRSCMRDIPAGAKMLLFAHRPFPTLQPYAETGPVFLCVDCEAIPPDAAPPPVVARRAEFLVKGYDVDDRIREGTGRITPTAEIPDYCETLFADPAVAYVHLRSATNNCFICRVDRA